MAFIAAAVPASAQEAKAQDGGAAAAPKEYGLKLKGLDGKTYDVSEMRGEVVLVSFGATWCAPCVWELEALEELKQEYKGKPVRFLWVSVESKEQTPNELLRDYARSNRLTIPVLRDPDKAAFLQFSERVRLPMVVLFDRQGRFSAPAHRGMTREVIDYKRNMRARIDALLRAAPQTNGETTAAPATN